MTGPPAEAPARYWPRTVDFGASLPLIRFSELQHLQLFVAHGVGVHRGRRLHGDEAEQLQHVVLHHVAQRAGLVVVADAVFEPDRLGHRDLHMVDMRGVPQRLEERVGEAQRHQVLHRLLAEIVVDAEDLLLAEIVADQVVERVRRGEIAADRLFHARCANSA